jgi:hypothetical protein
MTRGLPIIMTADDGSGPSLHFKDSPMIRVRVPTVRLMAVVFVVCIGTAALRNSPLEPRRSEGKTEIVLDRPDGYVTDVDSQRAMARVSVMRRHGARTGMKMGIFDPKSPVFSIDEPKAMIELIETGEKFSTSRIIKTNRHKEPIRVGDAVYSVAWSPNQPMRFALVGKIDFNHDGKDDRDELKRLIKEAGGLVDFDLPPPDVGRETGMLSPRIDWYVFDEPVLPSEQADLSKSGRSPSPSPQFEKHMREVIKEARLNGIRPIRLERLLDLLGYGIGQPSLGRPKAASPGDVEKAASPR